MYAIIELMTPLARDPSHHALALFENLTLLRRIAADLPANGFISVACCVLDYTVLKNDP